jgi:hypothetical protein
LIRCEGYIPKNPLAFPEAGSWVVDLRYPSSKQVFAEYLPLPGKRRVSCARPDARKSSMKTITPVYSYRQLPNAPL